MEPASLHLLHWQVGSLPLVPHGSAGPASSHSRSAVHPLQLLYPIPLVQVTESPPRPHPWATTWSAIVALPTAGRGMNVRKVLPSPTSAPALPSLRVGTNQPPPLILQARPSQPHPPAPLLLAPGSQARPASGFSSLSSLRLEHSVRLLAGLLLQVSEQTPYYPVP